MTAPNYIGRNIPGAPGFFLGKYIAEANFPLSSGDIVVTSLPTSGWHPGSTTDVVHPRFFENHHVHYVIKDTRPAYSEFLDAPILDQDGTSVISLPEGQDQYIWFLGHDPQHRHNYSTEAMTVIGPYSIDDTAPDGYIVVAYGFYRVEEVEVHLDLYASDNLSDVSDMYIDGDLQDGANVRTWIPYTTEQLVNLTADTGKKTVTVQFRDNVGNTSSILLDDVTLGKTRYYFLAIANAANALSNKNKNMDTTTKNLDAKTDNQMR